MSKILVVDDATEIAEAMALLFETLGHETMIAADGRQGLELARTFGPAVVFMDLDMPVMNGYDAARALRSEPDLAQPFLIALTASIGVAVEVATKAVGFDFYLHKPADTNALLALVDDLSTRTRQGS